MSEKKMAFTDLMHEAKILNLTCVPVELKVVSP